MEAMIKNLMEHWHCLLIAVIVSMLLADVFIGIFMRKK